MSLYEHVFIARQDISSSQVDSIADAMEAVIKDGGGEVKKREYWGLRNLAYRIKKNRKGHYVLLGFEAPGETLAEVERQERLHEDVLRYLTIRVDELDESPSVIMKSRSHRDDRGGRGRGRDDRGEREPRDAAPAGEAKPAAKAEADAAEPKGEDK